MRYAPYTSNAIHTSCATTRIDILARCVNRLLDRGELLSAGWPL